MKSSVGVLVLFAVIVGVFVPVFAGDLPEAVPDIKEADIFIGEITEITDDEITVTVSRALLSRYEVPVITLLKFDYMSYDNRIPKVGDYCAVAARYKDGRWVTVDENNALAAKSDSLNPDTLKLYTGGFGLTERMNTYINDGTYSRAGIKAGSDTEDEYIRQVAEATEIFIAPEPSLNQNAEPPPKEKMVNLLKKYLFLFVTSTVISYCFARKIQRKPLWDKKRS